MKRRICVVTGARSEYSLLRPLLSAIQTEQCFELQLVACAMHLSPEFGFTVNEILNDGFTIDEKIEMLLSSDSAVGVTKSMGVGLIGFADAFNRLQPDLIILLGDRFETLVAAQAALIAKIPVAHIHGGELSLGAYDDSIRHSITKMSHLHFTAAETYRNRVIQLGEQPERVYAVGPMVASSIKQYTFLEKAALEDDLELKFAKPLFLITMLPETLCDETVSDNVAELFAALDAFPDATMVFTKGNADTDGRTLNNLVDAFCKKNAHRAKAFVNLGQVRYLSLMKQSDVVIGNSSSGIIEAPFMRVATVNIGKRQAGRIRHDSIIDSARDRESIQSAIRKAISFEHQSKIQNMKMLGEEKCPSKNILEILKNTDFSRLIYKEFFELEANS